MRINKLLRVCGLVAAVFVSPVLAAQTSGVASLRALTCVQGADRFVVTVHLDSPTRYNAGSLKNPDRIYVDLLNTRSVPKLAPPSSCDTDGLVGRVRLGTLTSSTSRIVLDLREPAEYQVVPSPQANELRVVLERKGGQARRVLAEPQTVSGTGSANREPAPNPDPPSQPQETPAAIAQVKTPPVPQATAQEVVASPATNRPTGPAPGVLLATAAQDRVPPTPTNVPARVVSGVVMDPTDSLIPGATAALSAGGREVSRTTTTLQGQFRFDPVPAGAYDLRVESSGFAPQQLRLEAGTLGVSPLRIRMKVAEVQQHVEVRDGESGVSTEPGQNADGIRLNSQQLENMISMGRNVVEGLSQMLGPGAVGGISVIVDGMPSSGRPIPLSEIQEVRMNSDIYSAQFATPGRGRIEVITKSGSAKYHGYGYFGGQDYHLDARNAFATVRPPQRRTQSEGGISGPIGSGKSTTFSASFARRQDTRAPIVYARALSGPVLTNAHQSQISMYESGQITRKIGENPLTVRFAEFSWSDLGLGVGGLVLPEAGTNLNSRFHELFSSYRKIIGANALNEFSIRLRSEHALTKAVQPGIPSTIVVGAFTGGGSQASLTESTNSLEINEIYSWTHGSHVVKAGAQVPAFARLGSNDLSNRQGTLLFSSLANYAQGLPFSFTQQRGDGHIAFWQRQVSGFVQDEFKLTKNLSTSLGLRYDWQNYVSSRHNFAPRASFAYGLGRTPKTVIRAGTGLFYTPLPYSAVSSSLLLDGSHLQQLQILNPSYPDPLAGLTSATSIPQNLTHLSSTLRLPYLVQYNFGVEHQLGKGLTLTTMYTGSKGVALFRSRDINAPVYAPFLNRPNSQFGIIRQVESSGGSKYQQLRTSLQASGGRYFTGMFIYELAKATDDTSGIDSFPANNWDPKGEWSFAANDTRHFVYMYGTMTAVAWLKLSIAFSANTGHPYTMTTGRDDYHVGMSTARPAGVARNTLRTTGAQTVDVRWSKSFSLRKDGPSLQVAADAFNVLNRVNYTNFVGSQSSPLFGRPSSSSPARRLQLSVYFGF